MLLFGLYMVSLLSNLTIAKSTFSPKSGTSFEMKFINNYFYLYMIIENVHFITPPSISPSYTVSQSKSSNN